MRRLIFFKHLFSFIFIFFFIFFRFRTSIYVFFSFKISFLVFFLFSKLFSFSYVYLCFKWQKDVRKRKIIRRRIFYRLQTSADVKRHQKASADVVWQIYCQTNIYILALKDINFQISSTGLRNLIKNYKNTGSVGNKKKDIT